MEEIYLHAEKIDKIYPGTKALDQVSFDIKRGVSIPSFILSHSKHLG